MSILHDSSFHLPPLVDDDEINFVAVADSENPLSVPLAATLQLIRRLQQKVQRYRETLAAAIHLLHSQEHDLRKLRERNLALIDELRALRREARAA